MIIDGVQFADMVGKDPKSRGIAAFIEFIEKKLGVFVVSPRRRVPFGRVELVDPLEIAAKLVTNGVILEYRPAQALPDEPRLKLWWCRIGDEMKSSAGGASVDDDASALYAALAESLERYLWWTQRDYYIRPRRGTSTEMKRHFPIIEPERFSGFSQSQQEKSSTLRLAPDASYLWIQGESLITGRKTYLPAQTVSAAWRPVTAPQPEPLIRTQITTGLATWPTKSGARLAGALECLERDAYMIMWFNQLTLPRIRISSLRGRSTSFDTLAARCEKYGLKIHIVPMLTDAPTHAICAIIEDQSAVGPRFAFGLKANRSLVDASEGAILEALRARDFTRREDASKHYDPSKSVEHIGHRGRVHYWEIPEHAKHLEFLIAGEEKDFAEAPWENDTAEEHLSRIIQWCREKNYECVSVSLGTSKMNPTSWHIELVVMPEIIPTHLTENLRHLGGERLTSVPRIFGYTPRQQPFTERPHPFC